MTISKFEPSLDIFKQSSSPSYSSHYVSLVDLCFMAWLVAGFLNETIEKELRKLVVKNSYLVWYVLSARENSSFKIPMRTLI